MKLHLYIIPISIFFLMNGCSFNYQCNNQNKTRVLLKSQCPEEPFLYEDIDKKIEGQYKDSLKHGEWRWRSKSKNKIIKKGLYKNDKQIGKWREFYLSGKEWKITKYKKGKKHGLFSVLDEYDGTILEKGYYKNDLKHGEWIEYYSNNNIKSIKKYNLDKKNGEWIEYHKNKKIKSKINYKDDKKIDTLRSWYQTGQKQIEEIYNDNGIEKGEWITWFPNGRIKSKSYYDDYGNKINLWIKNHSNNKTEYAIKYKDNKKSIETRFHENGEMHINGRYINGEKHGIWRWYEPDGTLVLYGEYKYGKKDGLWENYNSNGTIMEIITYKDGKIIKEEKISNKKKEALEKIDSKTKKIFDGFKNN